MKTLSKRDISFGVAGVITGFFGGLLAFVIAVPSGMDMIALYYPERLSKTTSVDSFSLDKERATSTKE